MNASAGKSVVDEKTLHGPRLKVVKNTVRPLGAFEHLLWLLDQSTPLHFSLAAQIEGNTAVANWQPALDCVQKRHHFLGVKIDTDGHGNPRFCQAPETSIPLRVAPAQSEDTWLAEMERELDTPFEPGQAPLVRAVLLHEPEKSVLILTAHHAMADGLSLFFVLRDLLRALGGSRLSTLPVTPSVESMLGIARNVAGENIPMRDEEGAKENQTVPSRDGQTRARRQIRVLRLSPELTTAFRESARRENTTVHGALSAALALAGRQIIPQWKENPVRILSPVDARKLVGMAEACGLLISVAVQSLEPEMANGFWELARRAKTPLAERQTKEGITQTLTGIQQALLSGLHSQEAQQLLASVFTNEAVVTNLGSLRYQTSFGKLRLSGLWGPATGGRDGKPTIGSIYLNI